MSGNDYANRPASALEETLPKELAQHEEMWARLKAGKYSLPYDFTSSDNQPTKAVAVAFPHTTNGCVQRSIQTHQLEEQLTDCVIQGIAIATSGNRCPHFLEKHSCVGLPYCTFSECASILSGQCSLCECLGSCVLAWPMCVSCSSISHFSWCPHILRKQGGGNIQKTLFKHQRPRGRAVDD